MIWSTAGAQQSVLSLLLPPPFSPSPPQKKEETFYYRNISSEGIILHYSIILIQKNRRRVKLQSLQFNIDSKTRNLHHVKSVIISAVMVCSGVANSPFLVVVEEQMSNAVRVSLLFCPCFAPPPLLLV